MRTGKAAIMTRTIQIPYKMAVQCSQCTDFAETAYVSDDGKTLEIFDVRCASHSVHEDPRRFIGDQSDGVVLT